MALIAMSERDLQRIEILSKVVGGRMTLVSAAHVLDLSTRQVRRLLERIRTDGAASIRHKAIGQPSNNRISDGVRDYAMTLVRERYADFGPTLAAEKLAERDGLRVHRLLQAYDLDGPAGLASKKRSQPSNRRHSEEFRNAALDLIRERYLDFGPTLAREKLIELHRSRSPRRRCGNG